MGHWGMPVASCWLVLNVTVLPKGWEQLVLLVDWGLYLGNHVCKPVLQVLGVGVGQGMS